MIVILNSPLFRKSDPNYDEDSLPPIGLGYIATHLQNHGKDVKLIDAVDLRMPLDQLLECFDKLRPNFIASNVFTTNVELVQEIIESIEFKTKFIIGGLSTKELHKEIVHWKTDNTIDVVIGDGELITLDIVNDTVDEVPLLTLRNKRVFKVDGGSKYFLNDISDVPLNRDFFLNEPVKHPFQFCEANIVASRGCIYNCTFCAAARGLNREFPIRERSVGSLKNELTEISSKFKEVDSIRVLDDLFLKGPKSIDLAIEAFRDFELSWRSMAHVMTFSRVSESKVKALKESGCKELFIGIESGSPKILSSIKKTSNTNVIIQNLTKVLKGGIDIKGYFIYGFPGETESDMEMTYKLALQISRIATKHGVRFRTSVFQYRPYHATEIYHDLVSQGSFEQVQRVEPNAELSDMVGRHQFNFHNGNLSEVDSEVVHKYIYRTINLTDPEIFPQIQPRPQARKTEKL